MKRETVAHGSLVAQYLLHITYATEKCWLAAEREKKKKKQTKVWLGKCGVASLDFVNE